VPDPARRFIEPPTAAMKKERGVPDQAADEYVVSDPELITRVRAGDRQAVCAPLNTLVNSLDGDSHGVGPRPQAALVPEGRDGIAPDHACPNAQGLCSVGFGVLTDVADVACGIGLAEVRIDEPSRSGPRSRG